MTIGELTHNGILGCGFVIKKFDGYSFEDRLVWDSRDNGDSVPSELASKEVTYITPFHSRTGAIMIIIEYNGED